MEIARSMLEKLLPWVWNGFSPWNKGSMSKKLIKFDDNEDDVLFSLRDLGGPSFPFLVELQVACYVVNKVQPWARNAFSPGQNKQQHQFHRGHFYCRWNGWFTEKSETICVMCEFDMVPAWRRNCFSPGTFALNKT